MPKHEGADSDGIVLMSEEALYNLTHSEDLIAKNKSIAKP